MIISHLQGRGDAGPKEPCKNPNGPQAALPSPPPPPHRLAPRVKGRGSGTTIQMQACRHSQVSGSKEKTPEALSPRALWRTRLKTAGTPAIISIPKETFEFLRPVFSGLLPHPGWDRSPRSACLPPLSTQPWIPSGGTPGPGPFAKLQT